MTIAIQGIGTRRKSLNRSGLIGIRITMGLHGGRSYFPEIRPTTEENAIRLVSRSTSRFWRRLGALLYDLVLLLGVLMLANAIIVIPYEVITSHPLYESFLPLTLMRLYLLAVIAGFYIYFWTHGGQTLGMRAWRIRVIGDDGGYLIGVDGASSVFLWTHGGQTLGMRPGASG